MFDNLKKLHILLLFLAVSLLFLSVAKYTGAATCGPVQNSYTYTGYLAKLSSYGKIEVSATGDIYVADFGGNAVRVFNSKGVQINEIPVGSPRGVAVDLSGRIYVAQGSYFSVISIDDKGKVSFTRMGDGYLVSTADIAVDSTGRIFVLDGSLNRVVVFGSDGAYLASFGKVELRQPTSVDIDEANGRVIVTSKKNYKVIIYSLLDYSRLFYFGANQTDGAVAEGYFNFIEGAATDNSGRIFVVDSGPDRVQLFDGCDYSFLDFIGSHGTGPGELDAPIDIAADSVGRIYISALDGRISIFRSADMQPPIPITPSNNELLLVRDITFSVSNGYINGDALTYEFQLATDENFTNIVATSPLISEGAGITSWFYSGLNTDGLYYWRARAYDGLAYGPWSATTNFKMTLPNSPPYVQDFSPANLTTSMDAGSTVTFSVNAQDPDGDALTYVWLLDGVNVAQLTSYVYQPSMADMGSHTVEVKISDAEITISRLWDVSVLRPDTAPVAPSANNPLGGEDVTTLQPEISVNNSFDAEGDALTYTFEVSQVSDFSNIVDTLVATEGVNITLASLNIELDDNTLYYWRAKSCEVAFPGVCSPYSEIETFFVNTDNNVSTTPTISYPNGVQVDTVTPALEINRSDDVDVNDILTYEFQIATDSVFANVIISATDIAGSPVEGTVPWPYKPGGTVSWSGSPLSDQSTYYWRARAKDSQGAYSGWATSFFTVNTANNAPGIPVLSLPALDSEVVQAKPLLQVVNSADADQDTLTYTFIIDTVNSFNSGNTIVSELVPEGVDLTSWMLSVDLVENATYYWKAKANDGLADSPWMETSSFKMNAVNEAPGKPGLKSPKGGVKVSTDTPDLTIYPALDPDGDMLTYQYRVSDDAQFGNIVLQSDPAGTNYTVPVALTENTVYYWKVFATDEHGLYGSWSDIESFMVNVANDPPSAPVISWEIFSYGADVILKIHKSIDPEGDPLTYNVQIFSDRNMTGDPLVEGVGIAEDGDITLWNPGKLNNGVYYWRARAHDGATYGSWSGTRVVKIDSARGGSNARTDKAFGRKRF